MKGAHCGKVPQMGIYNPVNPASIYTVFDGVFLLFVRGVFTPPANIPFCHPVAYSPPAKFKILWVNVYGTQVWQIKIPPHGGKIIPSNNILIMLRYLAQ